MSGVWEGRNGKKQIEKWQMKRAPIPIVERDPGAVLKVNIIITLFAVFSVGYVFAAAWIVAAATDAWGQRAAMVVMCVLVVLYGWLLVRLILLERRLLGKDKPAKDVCRACGYDLGAIKGASVCPECGTSEKCAECGYDLAGLGAGAVCPECGKGGGRT